MAKARSKLANIDEFASAIAKTIAAGRLPRLTPEIDEFLAARAVDIFTAAEGACRHLPPAGGDEALGFGYLFLLQMLLERVRDRADRGFADAAELIATFQTAVVKRVEAGEIDGTMLAYLGSALQQAKVTVSPELAAISAQLAAEEEEGSLPVDVELALDEILEASGGDPFVLVGAFNESGELVPQEAKITLAIHMAVDDRPAARAAAVLFLLDPRADVRRTAAAALAQAATSLSPVDLRRLIAMRNWRPEHERADIDAIIQKARAAGIACAAWDKNVIKSLLASPIDGAAAQVFQLISPQGRKKRLSSILAKNGVADAFTGGPQTRIEVAIALDDACGDVPMLAVTRFYLDLMVSHHLALSIARDEVPPLGLLQVAEAIGGADWQPQQLDLREALADLIAYLPDGLPNSERIAAVLADSDFLVDLEEIEDTWFEDDAKLQELVRSTSRRATDQLVTKLLLDGGAIAVHRMRWAEIFVHTALWMREAPPDQEMCWPELAIVARAVLDGHDLTQIGLMRNIAERTVAVLADDEDDDAL